MSRMRNEILPFCELKTGFSLASLFLLCSCASAPVVKTSEHLGPRCEQISTSVEFKEEEDEEGNPKTTERVLSRAETIGYVSEDCERFTVVTLLANAYVDGPVGMMSALALLDMATRGKEKTRQAMVSALKNTGHSIEDILRIKVAGYILRYTEGDGDTREAAAREVLLIHRGKEHADIPSAPEIVEEELKRKNLSIVDMERVSGRRLVSCHTVSGEKGRIILQCR